MAGIRLTPPEAFNFKQPDEWARWKKRFEQFRIASGLHVESAVKQVSTLLYCLGEESEDVLSSTNASEEDRKKYETVMEKFDSFFKVRKNVIFERARFNQRNQLDGESAEQYIIEVYKLAENCEYGDMTSEMIRDRIVVGIRDTKLSQRLQLDPDLTLAKTKQMVRQGEAVHEQQQTLQGVQPKGHLEEVRSWNTKRGQKGKATGGKNKPKGGKGTPTQVCMRCGKGSHPWEKCPAREAICRKCKRKGHYDSQCLSKTVAEVTEVSQYMEGNFLDTVTSQQENIWQTTINLCGVATRFKVDTGAGVTAISEGTYRKLGNQPLRTPGRKLYGPSQQPLEVMGQFKGELEHKRKKTSQPIFVIKGLQRNLLGLPAITAMEIAVRVEAIGDEGADTKDQVKEKFPGVFQGLGNLGEEYEIKLQPDAKPFSLYTPRGIPLPLREKVKQELDKMEEMGVISKVDEPTEWCAGMVAIPKKSGAIRICVDLKPLNSSVLRETHPLPKVDETLAQLSGAKVFSKLDANSGFWQIPLAKKSRPLTTFITPYGRFCFNKLPFGISSAPEHFQKRMEKILQGLPGVVCQMDDVLIFGKDKQEHDRRLEAVLERIKAAGVTLNLSKCEFARSSLKFLGHIIDATGIRADPEKTSAIVEMQAPTGIPELRRFLGMANQLGKFTRNLAELTQPLRDLLRKNNVWSWGPAQQEAFTRIKEELSKTTTLTLYNPAADMKVSADASSYGLGAVLLQKEGTEWKPVAFASRTMSDTERRYAQIEKEALASTWACEKFSQYILGKSFVIETDHKPLVPLLGTKNLDSMPPRILRFRLRLDRFQFSIGHVPGKELYTADTLSRAPTGKSDDSEKLLEEEAEFLMEVSVSHLPASKGRLEEFKTAQLADHICSKVGNFCQNGWPDKHSIGPDLRPYWQERGKLTIHNNLLLYDKRIVVPRSLQKETLHKIHEGHQGIQRCRMRAQHSVWWPGISKQVAEMVERCEVCAKQLKQRSEPLISVELPDRPWQKIATDLFTLQGDNYLLMVDYFSKFPEVIKVKSTTSSAIIGAMKPVFARHGIPETLISDNGPQYVSAEFREFSTKYNFGHVTSSPYFAQSNGQAERTVQTVKKLLKDSNDPHLALLSYRSTPLPWCNLSPCELLMGRKVRTLLPQVEEHLDPTWPYLEDFQKKGRVFKTKQKRDFDRRHGSRPLTPLPDNTDVWVTSGLPNSKPSRGRVVTPAGTPRSYIIRDSEGGDTRRNRRHLTTVPEQSKSPPSMEENPSSVQRSPIKTRSLTVERSLIVTRSQTRAVTRQPPDLP